MASAPTTSGTGGPCPPPWPDDVMSGLGGRGSGGSRCGSAPATCLGDRRVSGRPTWALLERATRDVATIRKADCSLLVGSAGRAAGAFSRGRERRAFRAAARPGRAGAAAGLWATEAVEEPILEATLVASVIALATAASACASGSADATLLEVGWTLLQAFAGPCGGWAAVTLAGEA